jgi:trans-2,3-dihydro-3-hydroxyanthranilic acid synthase
MAAITPIAPYELPAGLVPDDRTGWAVERTRAVLLVHDMQEYFVRPFQVDAPPMSEVLANAVQLRDTCARAEVPVVYTAQPGSMTEDQRGLLKTFWGTGMTATPRDRSIVSPLAPRDTDPVLTKWRYSAFHRTKLKELLRSWRRDQLIICGVYAHIGCLMTAVDAFTHDIQPFLVADAVADFSSSDHSIALSYAARCCASTPLTKQVLARLDVEAAS